MATNEHRGAALRGRAGARSRAARRRAAVEEERARDSEANERLRGPRKA